MQRPDEKKRAQIVATAARLFATRPYHRVRLEDIAAEARIGKGTLYIYFDNKEDLYFSLIYQGFAEIVDRLREQTAPDHKDAPAAAAAVSLRIIVGELVRFAFRNPHFFELMRTVGVVKGHSESDWNRKRLEFQKLLEGTIRRGVEAGEFHDTQPGLTALFIGGMVRSAMLFGPKELGEEAVRDHILQVITQGIGNGTRRMTT
jgi:AcrR family transcriptional regulator